MTPTLKADLIGLFFLWNRHRCLALTFSTILEPTGLPTESDGAEA